MAYPIGDAADAAGYPNQGARTDSALYGTKLSQARGLAVERDPSRFSVNSKLSQINDLLNQLAVLQNRAANIADGLGGSIPQPAEPKGGAVTAQAPTLVGSVDYIATALETLIVRLAADINRIEQSIG